MEKAVFTHLKIEFINKKKERKAQETATEQ